MTRRPLANPWHELAAQALAGLMFLVLASLCLLLLAGVLWACCWAAAGIRACLVLDGLDVLLVAVVAALAWRIWWM